MKRICIINVVGLTPRLLPHGETLYELAGRPDPSTLADGGDRFAPWTSPLPAVTCTSQATMLTGLAPRDHGIVANGWYFRETQEIRFWQQARSLIEAPTFYDDYETAKMFWWFNQSSTAKYSCTPKPHYGCDGSKVFDVLDHTGCDLVKKHGAFPFFSFWGPAAGIDCSRWIAEASATVMRQNKPQVTLVYLPHLDYDYQRKTEHDPQRVAEVDACVRVVKQAADDIDAQVVVVSEYGLVPVQKPVHLNRVLRQAGYLGVRNGPFGEILMPGESKAFAVADHQLAHVYVQNPNDIPAVRQLLENTDGVCGVYDADELELDHPRSGELIALAKSDAWFTYYYWLQDEYAPDFARTVDIHRKPGYDPCELFMTSKLRAAGRLMQKKLGMRYKMDVIPLEPTLVRGSHGVHPDSIDGPLIIGPGGKQSLPTDMRDFAGYAKSLLE
ncbi:alkaline phosphatase family protein [Rhodopirellula sp. MGV]|uniref:alkaline phosphatase family protein n=1 Tax=Rhodopirellula sp. MGV TaxID=2023130 RepID=UPI000B9662BA|nr:nucleotide pyrophosphatase/phosphodiesterase family protein [Rhodopirellula sp. MGV]OYP35994.1 alkaline phosphatase family protein [Rhodopirellula sp. MGV]PNY36649.1 alkaline phosphatase family protein [Rhodopirellula baltica]